MTSHDQIKKDIPTFIFIDGSYYCFYRYYSLVTWWNNKYPEQKDEITNPEFIEKFKELFIKNIQQLPNKLKINKKIKPIIFVAKDCKRENIWRNSLYSKYKSTRINNIYIKEFFKLAYQGTLFLQGGAKQILQHDKLEGDDCIAITMNYLLNKYPLCNIYIITSDKDFLQLERENVHIYNLMFKKITDNKSSNGNAQCDLFCKILMGDKSDNIPSVFPKCGPKTALKFFNNKELLTKKLNESALYFQQYELNTKIIDFNYIPTELVEEFVTSL